MFAVTFQFRGKKAHVLPGCEAAKCTNGLRRFVLFRSQQIDYRKFFLRGYNLDNFFPLKNSISQSGGKWKKWEQKVPSALRKVIRLQHLAANTIKSLIFFPQSNRSGQKHTKKAEKRRDTFYLNFSDCSPKNRLLYCNHRIMSQLKHYNIVLGSWNFLTRAAYGQIANWFACWVNFTSDFSRVSIMRENKLRWRFVIRSRFVI